MTDESIDLEALAVEHAEITEKLSKSKASYESRIRKNVERLAEVESLLARHAPPGDSEQGTKQLRVTHSVSPDKSKLKETYPQADYPDLWTSDISATAVKKRFGEDEYSRYQVPTGKAKITIHDTI